MFKHITGVQNYEKHEVSKYEQQIKKQAKWQYIYINTIIAMLTSHYHNHNAHNLIKREY